MIIFMHKNDTLRILADNIQESNNLRLPVESYNNLTILVCLYNTKIINQFFLLIFYWLH